MADRTSEGVRVCVRCGREGGLRDVRCAECGFDLTSDLQRDYDRYRSTTTGRGQSISDSFDGAQPRTKTSPNAHRAIGRFTPAPGGQGLDAALDGSPGDRADRSSPAGSPPDTAARTRGSGQRVLGASAMRPPAPPPPPRLTGTSAPGARRPQVSERQQPSEPVADPLAPHPTGDEARADAGPRTTAWHPGSASDDRTADPKLAPVGEGGPGDLPVTRGWGDVDGGEREREAAVAALGAEADADEGAPPAVAALAPAPSEDATVSLRVEDFVEALAAFGLSDDDDDDEQGGFGAAGSDASEGDDSDLEGGPSPLAGETGGPLAGETGGDEATVMLQAVSEPADERTVAMAAAERAAEPVAEVAGEHAEEAVDSDAPTVMAARPTVAEAPLDPLPEDDDARTVVAARAAKAASEAADDDAADDEADTSETEAVEVADGTPAEVKRPGSRRKKRQRPGGDKGQAAARPGPAPDAEATQVVAAVEPAGAYGIAEPPVAVAAPASPAAAPQPAQAAAGPSPSPGSVAPAAAATRPGDRADSRPMVASDAPMRAEALAPSRAFGARAVADPISQNLRPGTTTYVDATRKGFRRAGARERDGSGVYVAVGVALGLLVLAALLYFSR